MAEQTESRGAARAQTSPKIPRWWAGRVGAPQTRDELAETTLYGRRLPVLPDLARRANGLLDGLQHHWLAIVNTVLITLIGVATLAPLGYTVGLTGLSDGVFHFYRFLCGQTPSHSFYIAGYQMCLCTRCLAIYTSILLGGILLAFYRDRHIRPLKWYYWVLAMAPMGLDGGTQLFGLRESNLGLRLLTGGVFGLATAWFLFPQIEEASRPHPAAPAYAPTPQP